MQIPGENRIPGRQKERPRGRNLLYAFQEYPSEHDWNEMNRGE